jgi:hypothetical protein
MRKTNGSVVAAGIMALAAACATAKQDQNFPGGSGSSGSNGGGFGGDAGFGDINPGGGGGPIGTCVTSRACSSSCSDFPSSPILDGNASQFNASSSTSGGPCILEPGDGTLVPNNWVRPRIRWTGGSGPFKITIHSGREANDLVVYTSNSQWTMPKSIWTALAASAWDDGSGSDPITITVANASGGSQMKFSIAPANANGSMIYWTAAGDVSGWAWLEGFKVGDESATPVLTAPTGPYEQTTTDVQWTWSRDSGGNLSNQNRDTHTTLAPDGEAQCIGCHVAVPDTNSLAYVDFYPWDGVASAVDPTEIGKQPQWLTPGGAETLSQGGLGMMSFSTGSWSTGQHLVVAATQVAQTATQSPWQSIGGDQNPSNLIWIDLSTTEAPVYTQNNMELQNAASISSAPFYANQGKTYGFINRDGDTNSASSPTWSHDGTRIVYASNNAPKSGRLDVGKSDLYSVPFSTSSRTGGAAKPVNGAADSNFNEYYPAFSPDDKFIAYNRGPGGQSMFYQKAGEVFVVPANGGTATRLTANDPPACMGASSPGVTNSWPRWSPENTTCGSKTYYWLIFSSSRLNLPFKITTSPQNFKNGSADGATSQLYLAALVDDGNGNLKSYPAVYIWNQSTQTSDGYAQSNHTPAWEVVNIPMVPPPK